MPPLNDNLNVLIQMSLLLLSLQWHRSNFCGLPSTNLWQHFTIPLSKSSDSASTYLVPHGTKAITASGFIGFKKGNVGVVRPLTLLFPNDSSPKKPFATSFVVPSSPNVTILLNLENFLSKWFHQQIFANCRIHYNTVSVLFCS